MGKVIYIVLASTHDLGSGPAVFTVPDGCVFRGQTFDRLTATTEHQIGHQKTFSRAPDPMDTIPEVFHDLDPSCPKEKKNEKVDFIEPPIKFWNSIDRHGDSVVENWFGKHSWSAS